MYGFIRLPVGPLIGAVGQVFLLPLLSFCFAFFMELGPRETMSILIVSCCPGGTISNVIAYWLGGDVALRYVGSVHHLYDKTFHCVQVGQTRCAYTVHTHNKLRT